MVVSRIAQVVAPLRGLIETHGIAVVGCFAHDKLSSVAPDVGRLLPKFVRLAAANLHAVRFGCASLVPDATTITSGHANSANARASPTHVSAAAHAIPALIGLRPHIGSS